ncbi:CBM96 family carbohydrate-binding protein [Thermococcus celericrescens]|uniref:CBM96 family carbohydrate-binding protein n=1 Tax=Thermococcus celericrescens TaxID=227598 RepID=UPI001FE2002F|nr:DNRLRE domain-containing protein [Thermococcus celericrescens]
MSPTDDAYVNDASPDTNYGTESRLYVGTYYSDGSNYRSYLKFDLSGLPEGAVITSARLYVYTYYGAYGTPVNISVCSVDDDSWSETSITWNTKPNPGTLLDKDLVGTDGKHWSVWDVTSFVQSEFNSDKIVSFVLMSDAEGDLTERITYNSKETTYSTKPYLEITYEVSEIPTVSIQEIQGEASSSPYAGQVVKTTGVVTFVASYGFAIQNGSGPWSGVWVYTRSTPSVNVGDYVSVQAMVKEYDDFTEINYADTSSDQRAIEVLGTAEVPDPVVLPTGNVSQEQWESVLVEVRDVRVINPDLGHGEWEVDDGTGPVRIDDKLYDYSPGHRSKYVYIRGIVWYSYGNFKIEPRDSGDIEVYKPNPNAISYGLTMYYSRQYDSRLSDLENLYENFTNTVSELVSYGVSFDSDVADKINWVNDSMSKVMEEYSLYEQFKNRADKTGFYLPAMIHLRKALFLGEDVKEEIQFLLPHLQRALEEIKAAQQMQEPGNETETGAIPDNETAGVPTNTTQNASQQTPAMNITITIPKVLIDASHGQYYINEAGVSYLVDKIQSELGWEVEINQLPLTYDLLKEYDVVILTDPKDDFTPAEIESIKKYVENGGGLLIAGEWYKYANVENFNEIVGDYGITFNPDELMDDDQNSGRPYYPFVGVYNKAHPVMKFVPDDWTMYYNGNTLTIGGTAVWLIKGYDTSYSVDADGKVVRIKGTNPVIAAAVDLGTGRIVAYGSSKALSDSYNFKYIKSNWPFIKGALLWLAHQE